MFSYLKKLNENQMELSSEILIRVSPHKLKGIKKNSKGNKYILPQRSSKEISRRSLRKLIIS
jgi:hypothetical protein